jgi:WD40 repeat protein/tetratricopeptide (TPR) repeat protein/predicted Ser/Thr protein kinase
VRVSLEPPPSFPASGEPHDASVDSAIRNPQSAFTRFGDYELQEEIARGGMGVVYRARQVSLNRTVAVKMILAGQLAGRAEVQRFRGEAEAAANLNHPNIVAIHEIGQQDGQHFFSMDYVEGQNLAEFVGQKPLPPKQAAKQLKTIAEAIHYAHEHGILHRDLKPSNILIDQSGQPRVTDFGLAKQMKGDSDLTLSGQVLGSPNFMPPEQAAGKRGQLGPHSDVYALGAILFYMLTARPPFAAESMTETLQLVVNTDPPSPRLLNPAVPRDLETICLKCLEKEPHRRYGAAYQLAEELARFIADRPILARPAGRPEKAWRWCRRNPVVASFAAATLILLLAVAIGSPIAAFRINREKKSAQSSAAESRARLVHQYVANGTRLVDEGDLLGALPWFAQALKEEQDNPERAEIHRLRLESTLQQCPKLVQMWFHEKGVDVAVFSPDGSRVLTGAGDGTARVWDATSWEAVSPLLENPGGITTAAFSPDGRYVATAGYFGSVGVWEVNTGRMILPFLNHESAVQHVVFSPDGRHLLTASYDKTAQIWDAATGARIGRQMKDRGGIVWAAFSPDGSRVVTAGTSRTARVWDANTGEPASPPLEHDKNAYHAEFSPDGKLVVTGGLDGTARVWDAQSWKQLALVRHQGYIYSVTFSPDGRRVVTASADGTATVWETATGMPVAPPMRHAGQILEASFSPDGRCVVTASFDGTARVWTVATGKPASPPLRHGAALSQASFSPDGQRVLAVSGPVSPVVLAASANGTARLWDLAGGEPTAPIVKHPTVVHSASFTPDGQLVSTVSLDGTACLWDSRTGKVLAATLTNLEPVEPYGFTADGRAFVQAQSNEIATVLDFRTSRPFLLALRHNGRINHAECSPDGRRMVTASEDHTARVWDALTGKPVGPPLHHEGSVRFAGFSPDSRLIVTASSDQTARLWDAATGEPVTPPLRHGAMVHRAVFSPDGGRLLTTTSDGKAQIWVLPTERRKPEDEVLLAQLLAGHQVDGAGAYVPMTSGAMEAAWRRLRPRYPAAFTATPEQVLARQRRQAEEIALAGEASQSQEYWRRAVRLEESNQWTEAIAAFSKAIELGTPDYGAYWHRSSCYAQIKSFREAIHDCNEYLWRWHEGSWQEGFSRILSLRGQYHVNLGEHEQAIADFTKAMELKPDDLTWPQLISACNEARQLHRAVDTLSWVIRQTPQNTNALVIFYSYRGQVHLRLDNREQGEADFRTAMELSATDPTALNNLAWSCVTGPVNFQLPEKALPLALKAVELSRTNPVVAVANTLGVVYYRLGRFTNAVEVFERNTQQEGGRFIACSRLFLAMSYKRLGESAKAESAFAQAAKWLEENPDQEDVEMKQFRVEAEALLGKQKQK